MLKVGDKVKVLKNYTGHDFPIGSIVEMDYIDCDGDYRFKYGTQYRYMDSSEYYILPNFKIGDKVRLNTKFTTDDYFWITDTMIDDYDVLTISSIGNDSYGGETEIKVHENSYSYHPSWLELVDDQEEMMEDVEEETGYTTITAVHFGNYGEYTWQCDRELFEDINLLDLVVVDTVKGEQVVQVVKKSETLNIKGIHKKVIKKLEVY